ncbi:MAG: transposase [Acidimicrobiia bacterium]|nr:transposase [Acidimicrobiia bacterium]
MLEMMKEDEPVRRRRTFSPEFKHDAVAMVLEEGRTIASVARTLNVGETSLGKWVMQARVDQGEGEGLTSSERDELSELRKENARLRMERDLLKRATAFWVKESGQ